MSALFFLQQSWHPAFFGLIDLEILYIKFVLHSKPNTVKTGLEQTEIIESVHSLVDNRKPGGKNCLTKLLC
jgi:hypothetical protein